MLKSVFSAVFLVLLSYHIDAQGTFSGSLQLNADFYMLDSNIQAPKDITLNYTNNKTSTDSWFKLVYSNADYGIDAGVRFDVFNNSIIFTPLNPYSGYGIGNWYITKSFQRAKITAGNFYEQFGSGIAFRAYEERALGIDNSLLGVNIELNPTKDLRIKAIAGLQKYQFEYIKSFIKGINIDYNKSVSEKVSINPGISAIARTLDQTTRDIVKGTIETYPDSLKFASPFNTYVISFYNTLRIHNFSWFFEGAYKTKEAIFYPETYTGKYENKDGNIFYTSLSYSVKGFGVTAQLKRTENFSFHSTNVAETNVNKLNSTRLSFIPATQKQHSLRLPSRYVAVSQEIEEYAAAIDFTISLSSKYGINIHSSYINSLGRNLQAKGDSMNLYLEGYIDFEFKKSKNGKTKGMVGVQYQRYNQKFYQGAEWKNKVNAITGFGEFTYKFTKKKSLRAELQYQYVPRDFGQWLYALVEFNIAPKWSFSISDMWNFVPNKDNAIEVNHTPKHYYTAFSSFTYKQHKFTLGFIKQVGGIICTGGVCRPEPAFSGIRFSMNTSF